MEVFSIPFLLSVLSIVMIDILLAGDNAVIIAMAVRSLPPKERRLGILAGSAVAVVLRVILTFFAAQLLQTQFIKLVGGVLILWIAVKLLAQGSETHEEGKEAQGLWQAMWYILVADVTMSLDNILAVAGASKGHFGLLLFGLGLSIPFVVFTSNLLSNLMVRYPIIVWIGAVVLGRVGGEMIITDPWVITTFAPAKWMTWLFEAVFAVGVIAVGKLMSKGGSKEKEQPTEGNNALSQAGQDGD